MVEEPGASDRPRDGNESDGPSDAGGLDGVALRRATPDDYAAVLRVIEGALLAVDAGRVRGRIDAGEVLVAVGEAGTVVGALVRDGDHLVAVAVRRRRRRQGIGRALVERALGSTGRLTAAFDPRVRGFYEALGFEVGRSPADGTDGTDGAVREADAAAAPPVHTGDRYDGDGAGDDRLCGVRTG